MLAVALLGISVSAVAVTDNNPQLKLVPWPKSVAMGEGKFQLTEKSRIIAADPTLGELAEVLSDEVFLVTGLRLNAVEGRAGSSDIELKFLDRLDEEAYELEVTDRLVIRGGDYTGVVWGTSTLLQALEIEENEVSLPCMVIKDHPDVAYRGFMEDVARQLVTIEELKKAVILCRFYKVRYLHLHLNDNHAWTFPSEAFPKLGSANSGAHSGPSPRVYDISELKSLVHFADVRGVTIIPELEGPGHSNALRIPMPDLFDSPTKPDGRAHLGIINMAKDEAYAALDKIAGEMAKVFESSPYIHIGCDEVGAGAVTRAKEYEAFIKKHDLKDAHDLFGYYVQRMVEIVIKHGKTPIAWDGAVVHRVDPADLIIMMWTGNGRAVEPLIKKGFRVINNPNHNFNSGDMGWNYDFDLSTFGVGRTFKVDSGNPLVLGGQLQDWESTWNYAEPIARKSVPARIAALWNTGHVRSREDFTRRHKSTDSTLERLLNPVVITDKSDDKALFPHTEEIKYILPRAFDSVKGIQRGRRHKLFVEPVSIAMTPRLMGLQIRFTLDGSKPTMNSKAYTGGITITDTTELRIAAFDKDARQLGPEQRVTYERVDYEETLTYGKPVTTSSHQGDAVGDYIVNGFVMKDIWRGWWSAGPAPQWASIDLKTIHKIDRIVIFPYWDDGRYYQYTVEVSTDDKNWKQIVDMSDNTGKATSRGHEHKLSQVDARYIRINMLKNSANPGLHLVEVRAYEPE